ncbi:MAG TPA: hypothetical protein ACFYEK_17315 [Candidatus Wunengus sp. YC60]|uniref:hypothetical protein n=1 Tax=Candidatus Wunengus sp. YC60 TaxID=3367697 RepID=UPI0040271B52
MAKGFSDEEKAAMRDRVQDTEGEQAVLAKINAMQGTDLTLAKRLHAIIRASTPTLTPKTWYGMPAYADREGKVVCFFQSASRFKTRYLTLGFSDKAHLDDGAMWPTTFAVMKLTAAEEAKISALVKKACMPTGRR